MFWKPSSTLFARAVGRLLFETSRLFFKVCRPLFVTSPVFFESVGLFFEPLFYFLRLLGLFFATSRLLSVDMMFLTCRPSRITHTPPLPAYRSMETLLYWTTGWIAWPVSAKQASIAGSVVGLHHQHWLSSEPALAALLTLRLDSGTTWCVLGMTRTWNGFFLVSPAKHEELKQCWFNVGPAS